VLSEKSAQASEASTALREISMGLFAVKRTRWQRKKQLTLMILQAPPSFN
jgi:hypothetical protein